VLFVNRQAVGVVEAKEKGTTLSGVEWQTVKYQANLADALPSYLIDGRDGHRRRRHPHRWLEAKIVTGGDDHPKFWVSALVVAGQRGALPEDPAP
jgi:hypothetical protein